MKGANALPCVATSSSPSNNSITTMGPSHHFFRTFMKAHNSLMMDEDMAENSKE